MLEGPITYAMVSAIMAWGVAWGTMKATINGTKERIRKLESANVEWENRSREALKESKKVATETADRFARIETKLDLIVHKIGVNNGR